MKNQINMENGSLEPLTKETVAVISQWEYEAPYDCRLLQLCTDT